MAPAPEGEPGNHPGASGVRVQRSSGGIDSAVPDDWLTEDAYRELAERVDRLAADADLVTTLALHGYRGRTWDYFATELAKYGVAVMAGWMRRKIIFARCRERGLGGLYELERDFAEDEVQELAYETVAVALARFRTGVLMTNKWNPTRGASLRTYFMGQCLFQFRNIYRRWWGDQYRNRALLTDDDGVLDQFSPRSSPAAEPAVAKSAADRAFSTVKDPRVRKAMLWTAAGWTQGEIATQLTVTEKTVERMLSNERKRLHRRRLAG